MGQFIEEMADPRGHHHRQDGADHREHDQACGDTDDLLPDGLSKHLKHELWIGTKRGRTCGNRLADVLPPAT